MEELDVLAKRQPLGGVGDFRQQLEVFLRAEFDLDVLRLRFLLHVGINPGRAVVVERARANGADLLREVNGNGRLLLVAAASWLRRTMPLVMVWTSVFLFVRLLASMLVDLKYGDRWRLLDLWNDLCLVGSACLGFENYTLGPAGQPSLLEASLVLLGVCGLCARSVADEP